MTAGDPAADLATWVASMSTRLTAGTNLFVGHLVETTGAAVFLREDMSYQPLRMYGSTFVVHERPRFIAVSRSTLPDGTPGASIANPLTARRLIHDVHVAVEAAAGATLSGRRWVDAGLEVGPQQMTDDARGRVRYTAIFFAERVASATGP